MESGVPSSLHQKFYHQIIYKPDKKSHYSPPYKREIWHCKYPYTGFIQRAVNDYLCERSLPENDVNRKVYIYLLKQSKLSSQTLLFHTKKFFVMTEIHRESVTKLKEKTEREKFCIPIIYSKSLKWINIPSFPGCSKLCYYWQLKLPNNCTL